MKKLSLIMSATLAILVAATGCEKELVTNNNDSDSPYIECFTPSDTKTYVDGLSVKWNADEEIYVIPTAPTGTKDYKMYVLSEGAGESLGKFVVSAGQGEGYATGKDVVAYTATPTGGNFFVGTFWYMDIPNSLSISEAKSGSGAKRIPMAAKGKIGEPLSFEHLVSMVRVVFQNTSEESVTLSGVYLTSDTRFVNRFYVKHPNTTGIYTYSAQEKCISCSGSLTIQPGESDSLYFVVYPNKYDNFRVYIRTVDDVCYQYAKASSFTAEAGRLHSFTASTDDTHSFGAVYSISIDGEAEQDYYIKTGFPKTPKESIKITSKTPIYMIPSEESAIISSVDALSDIISVDFTDVNHSRSWTSSVQTSKVADFYFPKSVVEAKGYYRFQNSPNIKLHISKSLTYIDLIWLHSGNSTSANIYGYIVDSENKTYTSKDYWLYDKSSLAQPPVLRQLPCLSGDIVIPEGVTKLVLFAVSNQPLITSVTLPSTVTTIENSNFYHCYKLKTIFCKSATAPTLGNFDTYLSKESDSCCVVIDTGDAATDITAKDDYVSKWGTLTTAKNWKIKTKAEYGK